MRTKMIRLGATLVAFAALAVGGSTIASAKAPHKPGPAAHQTKSAKAKATTRATSSAKSTKDDGETADAGNDTDGAAQAAACEKAGVTGDNVNYDDATGTCTADTGGND
jgi:hypothetical protein